MLSLAILTFLIARSLARASPSQQEIASIDSGSVTPWVIRTEAPWKAPVPSLATAAAAALPVFLDIAASTLIFNVSAGGGIHLGTLAAGSPFLHLVQA